MGLKPVFTHRWDLSPSEAIHLQQQMARRVVQQDQFGEINRIAACDVAFPQNRACAAVCLFSYPQLKLLEQKVVVEEVRFPYVPGLLSFRETPPLLTAFAQLKEEPDLLVVDGQGVAHPRRFGIASHIGVILEKPTIGCAKSILFGKPTSELGQKKGSKVNLVTEEGEVIGMLLRSKDGVEPLVISVGHRISLESAVKFVETLCGRYRIPDVQRIADSLSKGNITAGLSSRRDSKPLF
ncbi:MAG: deoxyribonuclease V [Planctomycetota bacterium]|nr:deoxyribonuclease V [Planctomycetota bacterium]